VLFFNGGGSILFGKNILKKFSQKTFLSPKKSDQKLVGGNVFLFLLLSLLFVFFLALAEAT
jgi:hypothetical protein